MLLTIMQASPIDMRYVVEFGVDWKPILDYATEKL